MSESSRATPDTNAAGGGAAQGGGGLGQCGFVDGSVAYGPIGEPHPLPVKAAPNAECAGCRGAYDFIGLRTSAGYGFLWLTAGDSNGAGPNLFSLTVDPNFEGGAPRALPVENSASYLNLVPGPSGFVATACADGPVWMQLSGDLDVVQGPKLIGSGAPCELLVQSVLWTGAGYLTAFLDTRGLVVALLDEEGAVMGEAIVSEPSEERVTKLRFSRNGDRILLVFIADNRSWCGVLDLHGTLLGQVQPMGEENANPSDFAIATSGDGWRVVTSVASAYVERGVRLTAISRDGVVSPEQRTFGGGYYLFYGFAPSAQGGSLLVAMLYTGGQFGEERKLVALIDDAGEIVYSEETGFGDAASWPLAVVREPSRDLVVESQLFEGSENLVTVQEYGCLH
jgi:hypothetical protein